MIHTENPTAEKSSLRNVDTVQQILSMMSDEAGFAASLRAMGTNTELASFVQSFVNNPISHELKEQKKRIKNAVQLKLIAFLAIMDKHDKLKEKIDQVKYAFGESTLTLWVVLKEENWDRETRSELYEIESYLRSIEELSHIELDFVILPSGLKEMPSNLTVLPLPPYAK